jgi:tripeptide aminopeptidase
MSNLLERFCRYVRIDTQAKDGAPTYPSSPGQWDLARLLVQELTAIGARDVEIDDHALVFATLPATTSKPTPTIAWLAHMDTSPETSGANVKPIVHADYDGGDIVLPGDAAKIIRVVDNPELLARRGGTIITSDGTTLLGADNKAGIAVIMAAAEHLLGHPELPHGPIRICFTCDEEIGHGVDHVDLKKLGAVAGYTLDGMGQGEIEGETFSADKATVTITGINIHPSIAKGRMLNAIRLAGEFLELLPKDRLTPETTEGREGFIHPVTVDGGVGQVQIRLLLRDFDTAKLKEQAELLRQAAAAIRSQHPLAAIEVQIEKQYRNMAEGLKKDPRALAYAETAMKRAGLRPRLGSIRGGTDGSRLTEMGLPTPNLSTGEHNPHSPLEWTSLEEMASAADVLIELAQVWAQ